MKNVFNSILVITLLFYAVPSFSIEKSKIEVYKTYNNTVDKMRIHVSDGIFLDQFLAEDHDDFIKYKLGLYNFNNSSLEILVDRNTRKISQINIISKITSAFWKNEDFISKMAISISMMNPETTLSRIYEIRSNLNMVYDKNLSRSKIVMKDESLKYVAYQLNNEHILSISLKDSDL